MIEVIENWSKVLSGDFPHNRFQILEEREEREMHTGENFQRSVKRDSLVESSMDKKMVMMFDELRFIREEQVNRSRGVLFVQNTIGTMHERLGHVIQGNR